MCPRVRVSDTRSLHKVAVFVLQSAKQHRLAEGDANTCFFHTMATIRQNKNKFHRLKDDNGMWRDKDTGLENLIYINLFSYLVYDG